MNHETFVCDICGERHEGLPTDFGFRLPDEVHTLAYLDRYLRSRHNADLCTLDESRYFVRCVLGIPLLERQEEFGWGVWVEVAAEDHNNYLKRFHEAAENAPRFRGSLANEVPGYEQTLGLSVEVQLGREDQRPKLYCHATSIHALAIEQREGISRERHHEILECTGSFEQDRDAVPPVGFSK
jgi:hypothetical protein